jgi:hypothetical protein
MGQERSIDNIVWQLPMVSAENNNTGCIHGNAKPHAFATCDDNLVNWSLCKKYSQYSKEYETINIEEVEEKHLCKKCLNSYKKLKKKEGNNNGA